MGSSSLVTFAEDAGTVHRTADPGLSPPPQLGVECSPSTHEALAQPLVLPALPPKEATGQQTYLGMVAHSCIPSTQDRGRKSAMSFRLAWATEQAPFPLSLSLSLTQTPNLSPPEETFYVLQQPCAQEPGNTKCPS